jgi:hypothetical protein
VDVNSVAKVLEVHAMSILRVEYCDSVKMEMLSKSHMVQEQNHHQSKVTFFIVRMRYIAYKPVPSFVNLFND